jgi:hypothetical protein
MWKCVAAFGVEKGFMMKKSLVINFRRYALILTKNHTPHVKDIDNSDYQLNN